MTTPTPPYATITDVTDRIGRSLTTDETSRMTVLLVDVSVFVDLNVPACVGIIETKFPGLLAQTVANAAIRALAATPDRDPNAASIQLGEATISYRYQKPDGTTFGLLTDDDIAVLRKACGNNSVRGLGSVPVTTVLHDMVKFPLYDTIIVNGPDYPEDDDYTYQSLT